MVLNVEPDPGCICSIHRLQGVPVDTPAIRRLFDEATAIRAVDAECVKCQPRSDRHRDSGAQAVAQWLIAPAEHLPAGGQTASKETVGADCRVPGAAHRDKERADLRGISIRVSDPGPPAALAPEPAVQVYRAETRGTGGDVPCAESPLHPDLSRAAGFAEQRYDRDLARMDAGHHSARRDFRYIRVPAAPSRSWELKRIAARDHLGGPELNRRICRDRV